MTKQKIVMIPRGKKTWVGKKYEDALLVGFGRSGSIILLTKIKGRKRNISRGSWSSSFWKLK